MAALTNPIEENNLASRFADYVVASANGSIVWGTNAVPTTAAPVPNAPEYVLAADLAGSQAYFDGSTAGRATTLSGATLKGATGETINAASITAALRAETAAYLSIRNLNAKLNVTGDGGNNGTRGTAGVIYDVTSKAYMNSSYLLTLGTVSGNPVGGTTISAPGLETYFTNLQTRYTTVRDTTVTIQRDVCHASCHSSCHGSRGRR
jgi:hypothetical protein